jgi:hypothetical protein
MHDCCNAATFNYSSGVSQAPLITVIHKTDNRRQGEGRHDNLVKDSYLFFNEVFLQQQVLGRVAGQAQLRRQHHLATCVGSASRKVNDPACVAFEVADNRIQLCHANSHAAIIDAPVSTPPIISGVPDPLQQLSAALFAMQLGSDASDRPPIEPALDLVLEKRCRPVIADLLSSADLSKVLSDVRGHFLDFATSISAAQPGRFIHIAMISQLNAQRNKQTDSAVDTAELPAVWQDMSKWANSPATRLCLLCNHLGLSVAEISRALGLDEETVTSALASAETPEHNPVGEALP